MGSGPDVVRGYWNKPEATAKAFDGEWLKTGDLAKIDEEGFLFIVDRKKDMLIRGGENIYCIEIEEVLYRHPAVMDAGVIGLPHRTLGEEPVAVVTLKSGNGSERRRIAGVRRPNIWPPSRCRSGSPFVRTLAAQCARQDHEAAVPVVLRAAGVKRRAAPAFFESHGFNAIRRAAPSVPSHSRSAWPLFIAAPNPSSCRDGASTCPCVRACRDAQAPAVDPSVPASARRRRRGRVGDNFLNASPRRSWLRHALHALDRIFGAIARAHLSP